MESKYRAAVPKQQCGLEDGTLGWKGEQNEREHDGVRGRRGRQGGVGGGWVPVEKYPIDKIDNGSFQRAFYESPEILVDLERSFVILGEVSKNFHIKYRTLHKH